MAWRIHEAVLRSVIDNRVIGRVKGHIWLQGREQPVILDLGCGEDLREDGFIVAALKRPLGYLHKSVEASNKVAEKTLIDPERLESFRTELFDVRAEVLELMNRFRASSS